MKRPALLLLSHLLTLVLGFGLGVYLLPIITAPDGPAAEVLQQAERTAMFQGDFRRDLADSDALHWGEGRVLVGPDQVVLQGRLAPGPDYKLYLSPTFVETEADFKRLKSTMLRVGDIKTFENFAVALPPGTDLSAYTTVIVWCETFNEFITAARYR